MCSKESTMQRKLSDLTLDVLGTTIIQAAAV